MASPTTQSTGELAPATTVVFTGHCFVNAATIQPGATLTVYDNTAASGKVVLQYVNAGTNTESIVFRNAVRCDIGLTVVGLAANVNVYFGAT